VNSILVLCKRWFYPIQLQYYPDLPVPVTARSKAQVYGRSSAEIVGSDTTGALMFVCRDCCVLSRRSLCDELITLPEKSY